MFGPAGHYRCKNSSKREARALSSTAPNRVGPSSSPANIFQASQKPGSQHILHFDRFLEHGMSPAPVVCASQITWPGLNFGSGLGARPELCISSGHNNGIKYKTKMINPHGSHLGHLEIFSRDFGVVYGHVIQSCGQKGQTASFEIGSFPTCFYVSK